MGYHDQRLPISIWFKETTLGTRNSTARRIFAGTFVNLISPRLAASRRSAGLSTFFFFLFYHFEWEWALKRHASLSVVKINFFTYIFYSIFFFGRKVKDCERKKNSGGKGCAELYRSHHQSKLSPKFIFISQKKQKKKGNNLPKTKQKRTKKKQKEFPAQNLPVGEVPASNVTRILKWFCLPR